MILYLSALFCIFSCIFAQNLAPNVVIERDLISAPALSGSRVLVYVDSLSRQQTHSIFFNQLQDLGYELTITDKPTHLGDGNVWFFDQMIFMAPQAKKPKLQSSGLSPQSISKFIQAGNNVIFLTNPTISEYVHNLVRQHGAEFEQTGFIFADGEVGTNQFSKHTPSANFDLATALFTKKGNKNSKITQQLYSSERFPQLISKMSEKIDAQFDTKSNTVLPNTAILSSFLQNSNNKFLFRGIGHVHIFAKDYDQMVNEKDYSENALHYRNPRRRFHRVQYSMPILSASNGGYHIDLQSGQQPKLPFGSTLRLASATQRINQARIFILGSLDSFSNEFYALNPANKLFAQDIVSWTFHQQGVLRIKKLIHRRLKAAGGNEQYFLSHNTSADELYTTTDLAQISIDILEWDSSSKKWKPFTGVLPNELQFEFSMLFPYVREPMKKTTIPGRYSADFTIPDVYGVFKFSIHFQKPGYTDVRIEAPAPVRPFRHNQYERFIPQAFPYYSSSFVLMLGTFLFVFILICHRPKNTNSPSSSSAPVDLGKKTK